MPDQERCIADEPAPEGISLHRFLTRLIWWCVGPLLLLTAYLAFDHIRTLQRYEDTDAANLARNFATAVDQLLHSRIDALNMLALSAQIDDPSRWSELYQVAQSYQRSFDSHVVFADTEGRMLFNTRLPFGAPLPPLPRPKGHAAVPAALATSRPAVGDSFLGPVAKEPLVAAAVPVLRGGKAKFVMIATVETRLFQRRIELLSLPPFWSLSLFDGKGDVIARRALSGGNGGGRRIEVQTQLAPWSVRLEVSPAATRAPLLAAATALTGAILLATLASLLGGSLASRRLARAVASLTEPPVPGAPLPVIREIALARNRLGATEAGYGSALAELRKSTDRYRTLLDNLPQIIWQKDPDSVYAGCNAAYARSLGIAPEELPGKTDLDFYPVELAEKYRADDRRILAAGEIETFDECWLATGGERYVHTTKMPLRDEGGTIYGTLGIAEDITERRQAERLLGIQNRALEQVATGIPLADILDTLARAVEAEAPGMSVSILLLDPDGVHVRHAAAPSLPEAFARAIDGQPIGERAGSCGTAAWRREPVIVTDIAGDPLWADYRDLALAHGLRACWSTPILGADRRVLGIFALYYADPALPAEYHQRLIALATHAAAIAIARSREQQALHDSEERYRSVVDNVKEVIFQTDTQGLWTFLNPAWTEVTGFGIAESLHTPFLDYVHPEDRRRTLELFAPLIERKKD